MDDWVHIFIVVQVQKEWQMNLEQKNLGNSPTHCFLCFHSKIMLNLLLPRLGMNTSAPESETSLGLNCGGCDGGTNTLPDSFRTDLHIRTPFGDGVVSELLLSFDCSAFILTVYSCCR